MKRKNDRHKEQKNKEEANVRKRMKKQIAPAHYSDISGERSFCLPNSIWRLKCHL